MPKHTGVNKKIHGEYSSGRDVSFCDQLEQVTE
jgi:hypothetical protein